MTPDLYQFKWSVPGERYEVISTTEFGRKRPSQKDQRFLVERMISGEFWVKQYFPLATQTGLFREFAEIDPEDEQSILKFAGEFGWLGGRLQVHVRRKEPGGSGIAVSSASQLYGEPIAAWVSEAATMAHLIRLWEDAVQGGEFAVVKQVITWDDDGRAVRYQGLLGGKIIASTDLREQFFSNLKAGELRRPALDFVRTAVNNRLNSEVVNSLLWDPSYREQRLHVVPTSLIGAIWLQFAKAIEGNKEYRQCAQCNRWFEVAAERREDAKFCHDNCRSKAYRERQKTARKLRSQGVSVREIARRLESDSKTIKKWVKT